VLGAIRYRPNTVFLHRDPRLMPRRRRAWASWNFLRAGADASASDAAVTYWMNALQNIGARFPLFVSLNPPSDPRPDLSFAQFVCDHPQYDSAAFAAQKSLAAIQGRRRTWFCGAWTGYGFHEDGLRSGLDVAEALGGSIPWRAPPVLSEAAE
jgi:predicted NAD/FAD-binding protein